LSILGYIPQSAGIVLMASWMRHGVLPPLGIELRRDPHVRAEGRICSGYMRWLATTGSVIARAGTFWIGKKAGEAGLERFVSPRRLRA